MDRITESVLLTDPAVHLAQVAEQDEPMLIERPDGVDLIIISERVFGGMQTTIELLSNPVMAERLQRSLKELDRPEHANAAE